ncbi:MAG: terpene cyclase/mutase family protein [Planctomycetes bacterium]|nr:terpene cyclase/mutase family protein [Planctomycetota bacterium]
MVNRTQVLAAIAIFSLLVSGVLRGEEPAPPKEEGVSGFQGIVPKQEAAIEKAVAWLAKNQSKDGSWGSNGANGEYRMAMTGLAGLALLSAGITPGRGPYGKNVEEAIRFCLKHQQADGLITTPNDGQSMYGHGFAMTFLAEACGMDIGGELDAKIRECLTKAAKLTAKAQSSWGGWYYSPNSGSDEGSVTITQVQALRACANIGITIPPKVMQNGVLYIHKSQNSDGGVRYTAQSGGQSSPALSAAGAELLLMAGQYDAKETKRVVDYVKKNLNPNATRGYHDFYTNFYGAQAMAQIGGADWERYFDQIRKRLLSSQGTSGQWTGDVGETYCTAIGVMILSLPYGYLPIFQK